MTVGGTSVNITSWTLSDTVDAVDVSHTGSGGRRVFISGLGGMDGSFEAVVDDAAFFGATSPGIIPGKEVSLVLRYKSGSQYSFTAQLVTVDSTMGVDGTITYTCTFQGTGAITRPTS